MDGGKTHEMDGPPCHGKGEAMSDQWKEIGSMGDDELLDELARPPRLGETITRDSQVHREILHRIYVMLLNLQPKPTPQEAP